MCNKINNLFKVFKRLLLLDGDILLTNLNG